MAGDVYISEGNLLKKEVVFRNGDLVKVGTKKKTYYYMVSSYVEPEEDHTAKYCVLMQFPTGHKSNKYPMDRKNTLQGVIDYLNTSYHFKDSKVKSSDVDLIHRGTYDIEIKMA